MAMTERPQVREMAGGKCWEHRFERFELKAYVPDNQLDGQTNNYGFRAPLLLVFEEERQDMDSAVRFARESGLAAIAAGADSSVLFVYPTAEGGWAGEDEGLYAAVIAEVKNIVVYRDGIVENYDFFAREFKGYFIRGAVFRADVYSFGASADYTAKHLLKTLQGEYLWGPGEITPAMCSMERLSVVPDVQRKDIASPEIKILVICVDDIQRVAVACYLSLVVVQRRGALIDDLDDTLIACDDALDGVGALDRLHARHSLKLGKDAVVVLFSYAVGSPERVQLGCDIDKICRQQALG